MLPQLQAERQLALIEAASVPHMTAEARTETLRERSALIPRDEKAKTPVTDAGIVAMGIKVRRVPARSPVEGRGTTQDETKGAK